MADVRKSFPFSLPGTRRRRIAMLLGAVLVVMGVVASCIILNYKKIGVGGGQ